MLQTKLLSLVAIVLSLSIIADVFKSRALTKDTVYKMEYLQALHPPKEIAKLMKAIDSHSKQKRSLEKYNERSIALKSISTICEDSLLWRQFIDIGDLPFIKKDISRIPSLQQNNRPELRALRNKFVYFDLLTYLSLKVGVGKMDMGCYSSKYSITKDLNNNLSLVDNYSTKETEILSINKQQKFYKSKEGEIRIPIADTLDFVLRTYHKKRNKLFPDLDTIIQHFKLDISKVPDGSIY